MSSNKNHNKNTIKIENLTTLQLRNLQLQNKQ
uniref:Uncharacterized protein n=1 Tax=Nelumbo nucifera TaxID=4432 RepID=A0A822ZVB0_NELNU|nr:TPA_asm: hypothetical protein HUJ06_004068 [Nelumbo nucifera]